VYFLRNENYELHVKNGTLGTIQGLDGQNFTVKLDATNSKGKDTVQFNIQDYRDIEHGYAATIHKAQGITVDRAYVLASKYFDSHTTYVAMSRHREGVDLYYAREEFAGFSELAKVLGRERNKDVTLDYTQNRNLEVFETKRLKHNEYIAEPQKYSLTFEKRMQAAEARINERKLAAMMLEEQQKIDARLRFDAECIKGRILSTVGEAGLEPNAILKVALNDGSQGLYKGEINRGGKLYGLAIAPDGQQRFINIDDLNFSLVKAKEPVHVEQRSTTIEKSEQQTQRTLEKQQQERQQRQKTLELDRGGFER
jgi:hypothetical protein